MAGLFLAMVVTPMASADGPSIGRVIVPGDHFQPGSALSVSGSQISGRHVSLRLVHGDTSVDIGQASVAVDGTFQATAIVPNTFPLGYAELTATDDNGNATSTIILIGDRAEGPQPAPWLHLDQRTIALIVFAIGMVIFVAAGAWYLRGRPKQED